MPQSSAPDVQQIWNSLCHAYRMPSPAEPGHQEEDKDEEREEDTRVTASRAEEPSVTGMAQAACTFPLTEGTGSSQPRTEEKNNLGLALLVK